MSLPNYNLSDNMNNINANNTNYIGEFPNSNHSSQPYPPYHPQLQHFLPPHHDQNKQLFYPPPPPFAMPPPPFDRDISPPRKRTRTTPEQLAVLEKSFCVNPSPNNRVREQLSIQLGMPERSIQIWFQNRRAKVKNQAKKSTQIQDKTLYMQQQYAASAAAAACQTAAIQQNQTTIDQNLYYYYYYYYFHQQRQNQSLNSNSTPPPNASTSVTPTPTAVTASSSSSSATAIVAASTSTAVPATDDVNKNLKSVTNNVTNSNLSIVTALPAPSTSYSTPINWSSRTSLTPTINTLVPDLSLSASTSSSSITSDNHRNHRRHHYRSSSATLGERTRAHSVGPYPYYRKSTPHERHSSLGPSPSTSSSNPVSASSSVSTTPTAIQPSQLILNPLHDSRLYNSSTIPEETYHIPPSGSVRPQQEYKLSAQALQIGTWKRVSDLDCQIDLATRTLTWCISDEQQSFRMDININLVQYIRIHQSGALHRIEFFLSTPNQIKFFMILNNEWVQCHDFTQDQQATLENIHVLEGSKILQSDFLEILMHAPDLQSLVFPEHDGHQNMVGMPSLYHHHQNNSFLTNNSSTSLLTIEENENLGSDKTTEDSMNTNMLLLQGLHLPQ